MGRGAVVWFRRSTLLVIVCLCILYCVGLLLHSLDARIFGFGGEYEDSSGIFLDSVYTNTTSLIYSS